MEVKIHINTISIMLMDQNFHMKDILITEGQILVNGQWVRSYELFIHHKYTWIIHLLYHFQNNSAILTC